MIVGVVLKHLGPLTEKAGGGPGCSLDGRHRGGGDAAVVNRDGVAAVLELDRESHNGND